MPARDINPHTIVLIRFSYIADTGFRVAGAGHDAARASLYEPARLERRFRLFEALTLPSLLSQQDSNFTLVVLVGTDFPPDARTRLESLIAPLPRAHIHALEPMVHFKATKLALTHYLDQSATHLVSVRLDDDDAISTDCIGQINRLAPKALELSGRSRPTVIGFNNGFFLEMSEQGNSLFGVVEKLPIGIGLAMIAPVRAMPTIFSRDHRQLHMHWNCYTDGVTPSFIRSVHRDNDSGAVAYGRRLDYSDGQMDAILRDRFATSLDALMAIRA